MKNIFLLTIISLLISCSSEQEIKLIKLVGSPDYSESELKLSSVSGEYDFSFDVLNYNLGEQTEGAKEKGLANSAKGQHIHFIVNNDPYSAHYNSNFSKELEVDNNVILAFLSRSYHESVKNKKAYVLTQISKDKTKEIDLTKQFLFYSRPKGVYKGEDTKKLLLDFYLVNTEISPKGNKVRLTVQEKEFIIDSWEPYYIEGLEKGEVNLKLELIDERNNLIKTEFNPSYRKVILE
jgi:hypothetical protein|tara:strand:- start:29 stop:736 length:708 start_codon:yes stop_codon:yes gene_type:complete